MWGAGSNCPTKDGTQAQQGVTQAQPIIWALCTTCYLWYNKTCINQFPWTPF